MHPDGKLWSACDPYPSRQDSAPRPPPLQHRVPIRAASIRLRRTPLTSVLPDCSGTFSVTGWAHLIVQVRTPDSSRCVEFQPHGSWTIRMSLSTLVNSADIAQRRVFGLFATPDMFGPNQSPLSAVHLPQALVSVVAASLPTLPFR